MIDPTGHEVHLNLDPPDEPDELELVYNDLAAAQQEIQRLNAEIAQLKALIEEFMALIRRAREATR